MNFNHKLHPKHIYRNLNPYIAPRLRSDDVPDIDEFNFTSGKETRSIWCEDKDTGKTLFVCAPPKTMREALSAGYMMGKAAGYKTYDRCGEFLIEDLFAENVAHYQLYGYYPDEVPPAPPMQEGDLDQSIELDDLPKSEDNPKIVAASVTS